ncbi:hypothetical protein C8R48DRAFT_667608 [Suillus tomentosus]|nr:hypothetical protein C8R48DRAFT_667608 [Suillus tomentosus]
MSDSVSLTNPQDSREIDVLSKPDVAHIGIKSPELEKETKCTLKPGNPYIAPLSPNTLDFNEISKIQKPCTPSLSSVSTELLTMPSPIMYKQGARTPADKYHQTCFGLKCEYAMYLESDEESDNEPEMTISDVLNRINSRFPALDFFQYQEALCRDGIAYLAAAVKFDCEFYVHTIGMSTGAASLFCEQIARMKRKNDRAVVQRKAKGRKRARLPFDDEDKENIRPSLLYTEI